LAKYYLRGKIIDRDTKAAKGLKVLAFDDDPLLNPDDFLGEDTTDSQGIFEINFDESKFQGFLGLLEGTPDVYLVARRDDGRELVKTRVEQTGRELEYHIKLDDHRPDPNAKDIYSDNLSRIIAMLGEVGNMVDYENAINLDTLSNGDLPAEVRERLEQFTSGYHDRRNNAQSLIALLNGVIGTIFEERGFATIGYDGPQVPRFPRQEAYNQTIIWPRKEGFKWA